MAHAATPRLRLVGHDPDPVTGRDLAEARRAVARENHGAATAGLDPTDPRWVLAVRAHAQLEGSALSPERRSRVMRTAGVLGLRPFDANLVIAIVQDQARRGADLSDALPSLALVPCPRRASARHAWLRWSVAIITAVVASAILIRWIVG